MTGKLSPVVNKRRANTQDLPRFAHYVVVRALAADYLEQYSYMSDLKQTLDAGVCH